MNDEEVPWLNFFRFFFIRKCEIDKNTIKMMMEILLKIARRWRKKHKSLWNTLYLFYVLMRVLLNSLSFVMKCNGFIEILWFCHSFEEEIKRKTFISYQILLIYDNYSKLRALIECILSTEQRIRPEVEWVN